MKKNYDMSGGEVTVNGKSLLDVAAHAVYSSKSIMEKYQNKIDHEILQSIREKDNAYSHNHSAAFYARELAKEANNYSNALDLYHAIYEHVINGRELTVELPESES